MLRALFKNVSWFKLWSIIKLFEVTAIKNIEISMNKPTLNAVLNNFQHIVSIKKIILSIIKRKIVIYSPLSMLYKHYYKYRILIEYKNNLKKTLNNQILKLIDMLDFLYFTPKFSYLNP